MATLITGSTGILGRHVLALLRDTGHDDLRVLTRGIPFSTLRAAQFHDLVLTIVANLAKLRLPTAATRTARSR